MWRFIAWKGPNAAILPLPVASNPALTISTIGSDADLCLPISGPVPQMRYARLYEPIACDTTPASFAAHRLTPVVNLYAASLTCQMAVAPKFLERARVQPVGYADAEPVWREAVCPERAFE